MNETIIPLGTLDLEHVIYDMDFKLLKEWKNKQPNSQIIGTFPVYVPHELIHALGHLPVNLMGGGEEVSISHADAILGSFICSISKSTTEMLLALPAFQENFDGFIFPFICDVARNLSGIFGRRTDKPSYMLHFSQNPDSESSITFLEKEYRRMMKFLFGRESIPRSNLQNSVKLYNQNRSLQRMIYAIRAITPWNVLLDEVYQLMRVGCLIPVEDHNQMLEEYIATIKARNNVKKDAIRVVITGNFCEQPPLDVIKLIEQVGCYVIDDEAIIGRRYLPNDIPDDSENLFRELAQAYIHDGAKIASRYHSGEKGEIILERVKNAKADGVIFLNAKFCEPALDDLVLQQHALTDQEIPFVHIEYEERGSGYENIRLSLETFVESMLFD